MVTSEVLRRFSFLNTLDATFLDALAAIGEDATVQKGEWVFHEGDQADALYFIVDGDVELKLDLDAKKGTFATVNTMSSGNVLGWSAIVEPFVYKLGALAANQTRLVRFDSQQLRDLLDKYPNQGYILMQGIAQVVAGRVSILSAEAPNLSFQLVTSQFLFAIGIATGLLAVVAILIAMYAATSDSSAGLFTSLLCLIVPTAFFFAAQMTYPKLET